MFFYKIRLAIALIAIAPMNVFGQQEITPVDYRDFAVCAHKVRTEHCISRIETFCGDSRKCTKNEKRMLREACESPKRFSGVVSEKDKQLYQLGIQKFQTGKLEEALENFSSIGSETIPAKAAFWLSYLFALDEDFEMSLSFERKARPSLNKLGKTKAEELDKLYLWGLYSDFRKNYMGEDFFGRDGTDRDMPSVAGRIERRGESRDLLKCFSKVSGNNGGPCDDDMLIPVEGGADINPMDPVFVDLRGKCEEWIDALDVELPDILVEPSDSL